MGNPRFPDQCFQRRFSFKIDLATQGTWNVGVSLHLKYYFRLFLGVTSSHCSVPVQDVTLHDKR